MDLILDQVGGVAVNGDYSDGMHVAQADLYQYSFKAGCVSTRGEGKRGESTRLYLISQAARTMPHQVQQPLVRAVTHGLEHHLGCKVDSAKLSNFSVVVILHNVPNQLLSQFRLVCQIPFALQ